MCSYLVGLLVIPAWAPFLFHKICRSYGTLTILNILCFMYLAVHTYDYIHLVRLPMNHVSTTLYIPFHGFLDTLYVKGIKSFISGLTFARGRNQPFRSNAIDFLSSSGDDIQTFEF